MMADSQAGDGIRELADQLGFAPHVWDHGQCVVCGEISRKRGVCVPAAIRLTMEATRQVDSSHLHDWLTCRMEKPLQATTESDVAARLRELIGERQK